jgi:branched-chain amino acid aminotransferase
MTTVVWVDGRVGDETTAAITAVDHGITVGDGVFETALVVDGEAFALTRHLRRLARSAAAMALPPPDDAAVRAGVAETLAAARGRGVDLAHARLRITVTGGPGPLGSNRGPAGTTLVLAVAPAAPWPADPAAVTVPWTRNERSAIAGVKSTSYAENVVALAAAHRQGAQEALLANTRGELCEGTGTNVVVVSGGMLVTPPLSSGCLAGITRELLLEWAAAEGVAMVEKELPFDVLATADDVLLTSSTRGVQPQAAVDGRPLPRGELARAAEELYERRAAAGLDP